MSSLGFNCARRVQPVEESCSPIQRKTERACFRRRLSPKRYQASSSRKKKKMLPGKETSKRPYRRENARQNEYIYIYIERERKRGRFTRVNVLNLARILKPSHFSKPPPKETDIPHKKSLFFSLALLLIIVFSTLIERNNKRTWYEKNNACVYWRS